MFVAVGEKGLRMSSTDGSQWSHLQTGKEGEVYRAACFGQGRFVAVGTFGGQGIFSSSADCVTWEPCTVDAKPPYALRGIGFGHGEFLGLGGDPGGVGNSNPFVATSTDGQKWGASAPIEGKEILRRVAWGNDRFVGVGDRGRRAASTDGRKWTDAAGVKAIDTLIDVAFGNGRFVGVGLHGLRMSSEDGVVWSERLPGEEGEHINSIVWTGDRFVAVGQGATYFSPDGLKWERIVNRGAAVCSVWRQQVRGGGLARAHLSVGRRDHLERSVQVRGSRRGIGVWCDYHRLESS